MRDPRRQAPLLMRVQKLWELNPDLRLGQLILNVTGHHCPDLYYQEDEDTFAQLERELIRQLNRAAELKRNAAPSTDTAAR